MKEHRMRRWVLLALFSGLFIAVISSTGLWETTLRFLFPQESQVLHPRASLIVLVMEHDKVRAVTIKPRPQHVEWPHRSNQVQITRDHPHRTAFVA